MAIFCDTCGHDLGMAVEDFPPGLLNDGATVTCYGCWPKGEKRAYHKATHWQETFMVVRVNRKETRWTTTLTIDTVRTMPGRSMGIELLGYHLDPRPDPDLDV